MASVAYCDDCIRRDFARIAEGRLWHYGSIAKLRQSRRSSFECRLCNLIWTAVSYHLRSYEDRPDLENWDLKLIIYRHSHARQRFSKNSKLVPENASVIAAQAGEISQKIDRWLLAQKPLKSSQRLGWFTMFTDDCFQSYLDVLQTSPEGECFWQSPQPPLRLDANDSCCFDLLRSQLITCASSHSGFCGSNRQSPLPYRYLDIRSDNGDNSVTLIENYEQKLIYGCYAALSYVWGRLDFKTTKRGDLSDHKAKIAINECPKTVQDAIHVARELDIPYLWVDSLCIIQGGDGEDDPDFARQGPKMGEIYGNAFLTIAAANTTGANDAFLKSRALQVQEWVLLDSSAYRADNASSFNLPGVKILCRKYWQMDFRFWKSNISSRAWCLQEMALSQRILSYHDEGFVFSCKAGWMTEMGGKQKWNQGSTRLKSLLDVAQHRSADLNWKVRFRPGFGLMFEDEPVSKEYPSQDSYRNSVWTNLVHDYTKRVLTYQEDKLFAFSGVASVWQRISPSEYLAGLWSCDIHSQILWAHRGRRRDGKAERHRNMVLKCPSWSWAAVNGVVDFHFGLRGESAGSIEKASGDSFEHFKFCTVKWRMADSHVHASVKTSSGVLIVIGSLLRHDQVHWPEHLQDGYSEPEEWHGNYFDSEEDDDKPLDLYRYFEVCQYRFKTYSDQPRSYRLSSGLILEEIEEGNKWKDLTELDLNSEEEVHFKTLPHFRRMGVYWGMRHTKQDRTQNMREIILV